MSSIGVIAQTAQSTDPKLRTHLWYRVNGWLDNMLKIHNPASCCYVHLRTQKYDERIGGRQRAKLHEAGQCPYAKHKTTATPLTPETRQLDHSHTSFRQEQRVTVTNLDGAASRCWKTFTWTFFNNSRAGMKPSLAFRGEVSFQDAPRKAQIRE